MANILKQDGGCWTTRHYICQHLIGGTFARTRLNFILEKLKLTDIGEREKTKDK